MKGLGMKVNIVNTNGYWESKSEHSFEVQIVADSREDYLKAMGKLADSVQSNRKMLLLTCWS